MKHLIRKLLKEGLLIESVSGKHLVVVDIQPEYESGFAGWLPEFINFLNTSYNQLHKLTFLYNGAETLGMIEEGEYKSWWYEQGLDEDIVYGSYFYDKGYAFFRYCLDEIGEDETTNLVRHMLANDVHDSRELDDTFWTTFIETYGNDDVRELMEFSDDAINIPDLIDEVRNYGDIVLCGGGVNECLKEVEIALNAINKPFNKLNNYTY